MAKGKVKWFNDAKGYGFIQADGEAKDIFVHYTSVKAEGFRTLTEGEEVEFELVQSPKGLKAENVSRTIAPAPAQ
jgi:CspA family cold shock protein